LDQHLVAAVREQLAPIGGRGGVVMTIYVSRYATTSAVSGPRPAVPVHTRTTAIGRAGVVLADPPLLTYAWRRVFAEPPGKGSRE
jgi:hypothetical protein